MTRHDKSKKGNSLSVRLTESAVFLRTDGITQRRNAAFPDARSSMLRGLLILDLFKPTKITSIEVELTATTSTAWPEGIGARRIEVTEEHEVFSASTTYFRGGMSHAARRTASIGPGVSYAQKYNHDLFNNDHRDFDDDWDEVEWEEFRGRLPRMNESVLDANHTESRDVSRSNSQSRPARNSLSGSSTSHQRDGPEFPTPSRDDPPRFDSNSSPIPPEVAPLSAEMRTRPNRRGSVDGTQFQRTPLYETYHQQDDQHLPPIPPYSPFPTSPAVLSAASSTPVSPTPSLHDGRSGHSAQTLEDFRISLQSSLRNQQHYRNQASLTGSVHSLHSVRQQERSLSRRPSLADVIPEHQALGETTPRLHSPEGESPHTPTRHESSRSRTRSGRPESLSQPRRYPHSPPPLESHVSAGSSSSSSSHFHWSHQQQNGPGTERGRKGSRFNLSVVSNILMDAVRSNSPRSRKVGVSQERDDYGARERSVDAIASRRGRTMERGPAAVDLTPRVMFEDDGSRSRESKERGIGVFNKIWKDKDKEHSHHHHDKGKSEGWKEFKKGTYSFPISFSIPANAPPSMQCDFGSVVWRLKAYVHRPGAFKPKMTASRDVMVVTCPTEEDTEDTENIIVERHWEQQLQYLISISGRSFYIGGTMPVTFTLMPLAKVKIHRLTVVIEEKVDYYTNMRRIARSDPVSRYTLLSIKGEGKDTDPILPLDSDAPDVLRSSPFFTIVDPNATDSELTEIASSLMGPGPWTFHQDLKLPKSCDILKFTNRNRRSNIIVSHMLKVVIRVERGDDLHVDGRTGKRKLYDIVVQTPVLILSCRCNPEWSSLPRYAEIFDDSTIITPSCPCQVTRLRAQEQATGFRPSSLYMPATLERITSRHSSDSSSVSAVETSPVNPSMRSLRNLNENEMILRSNILFERLISGQESANGEAPPSYEDVASSPQFPLSPSVLPPSAQAHGNGVALI